MTGTVVVAGIVMTEATASGVGKIVTVTVTGMFVTGGGTSGIGIATRIGKTGIVTGTTEIGIGIDTPLVFPPDICPRREVAGSGSRIDLRVTNLRRPVAEKLNATPTTTVDG